MIRVTWTDYPKIPCTVCGKLYKPKCKTQKTCSEKCRKLLRKQNNHNRNMIHNKTYELKCKNCGKTFLRCTDNAKYCSPECRKEYHEKAKNFTFTPLKKKPDPNEKCLHCTWFTPCGGQKGFCMFPTCAKERMKTNAYN